MTEPETQPAAVKPKRRWRQYSLRTLLLLPLLLALVFGAWPRLERRYILWRLQNYVDNDLRKLPSEEQLRIDAWLEKLIGRKADSSCLLHNADIPGIGRRMLVVQQWGINYSFWPYSEWNCRLDAVDCWGRTTHFEDFYVGDDPPSVAFDGSRQGLLCLVLTVVKCHFPNQPLGLRKFYRIGDEQLELIRAEEPVFGTCCRHWNRRNRSPERSDWQNLLESADRGQQLRGLAAWLYDYYDPPAHKPLDERLRLRLAELAKSPDAWISEEAKMALAEADKK